MPLTDKGYVAKTYNEILADQIAKAKELYGDDINTDSNTILGKHIRIITDELSRLYEMLSDIYFSRFPQFATGVQLDRLGTFAGITRNLSTPSQHLIEILGTNGYTVPNGFLVGTSSGINFYTATDVTLTESPTQVSVICVTNGTIGNVSVGQITDIVNPDANVHSINHIKLEIAGENDETDISFYERFKKSIAGSGNTTGAAIVGNVSKVVGVNSVNLIENDTDEEANGLPARSFQVFVYGDSANNEDIAQAIFEKKPPGVRSFGDISVTVKDSGGYNHNISFSRTVIVDIQIRMTIKTTSLFESDGVHQIQTAISNQLSGVKNDFDLVLSSLYGFVYGVLGVQEIISFEARYKAGVEEWSSWSTSNISTTSSQIPRILTENVNVTINNS